MPASLPATSLRVADLSPNATVPFALVPDADTRAAMAQTLELSALRKLRFAGELVPQGARDWRITARLGATVTQPCAVTLAPVTTRIDTAVHRLYLHDMPDIDAPEAEMPEDTDAEPLGAVIDLDAVMIEALSLALPDFPRADGAAFETAATAAPGVAPLTDAAMKPFAGLADLRARMGEDDTD